MSFREVVPRAKMSFREVVLEVGSGGNVIPEGRGGRMGRRYPISGDGRLRWAITGSRGGRPPPLLPPQIAWVSEAALDFLDST